MTSRKTTDGAKENARVNHAPRFHARRKLLTFVILALLWGQLTILTEINYSGENLLFVYGTATLAAVSYGLYSELSFVVWAAIDWLRGGARSRKA